MAKTRHYRAFLEPSSRSVDSYVHVDLADSWINLKIADCTRSVNLGFNTGRGRKTALAKVAKLEKALALVRTELERVDKLQRGAKNLEGNE